MRAQEAATFANISANTAAFSLYGGHYNVTCVATFGGGTVTLQKLAFDGSTWLTAVTAFSANGTQLADLAPGQYRFAVATATAVYCTVERVPND